MFRRIRVWILAFEKHLTSSFAYLLAPISSFQLQYTEITNHICAQARGGLLPSSPVLQYGHLQAICQSVRRSHKRYTTAILPECESIRDDTPISFFATTSTSCSGHKGWKEFPAACSYTATSTCPCFARKFRQRSHSCTWYSHSSARLEEMMARACVAGQATITPIRTRSSGTSSRTRSGEEGG